MNEEYERYKRKQAQCWLEHCRGLVAEVRAAEQVAANELAVADGLKAVDYSKAVVKSSPIVDAAERAILNHMEVADALKATAEECAMERADALARISRIGNTTERAFLTAYYLDASLPSCKDVAEAMNYSYDGIMKVRRRALSSAYEVMPHRWRDALPTAM